MSMATTDFQIGKINKHGLFPGRHGGLVLTTTVLLVMPKSLSGTLKVEMYDQEKIGSLLLHCC